MNPLEALLSVYLVAHSPFLARLRVEEIEVGSRLKLFRYTKSNGGTVMYQLRIVKDGPKSWQNSLLSGIQFAAPDQDFVAFLLTEDVTNHPPVGWPQRKDSGPFMRFGGYEWVWQQDGKHLAAHDELASFTLENHQARQLGCVMAVDIKS